MKRDTEYPRPNGEVGQTGVVRNNTADVQSRRAKPDTPEVSPQESEPLSVSPGDSSAN